MALLLLIIKFVIVFLLVLHPLLHSTRSLSSPFLLLCCNGAYLERTWQKGVHWHHLKPFQLCQLRLGGLTWGVEGVRQASKFHFELMHGEVTKGRVVEELDVSPCTVGFPDCFGERLGPKARRFFQWLSKPYLETH